MKRFTIQRPDGAWFTMLTITQPGWTDNPHLSYAYDERSVADSTLDRIFAAGLVDPESGDHPAIMERIEVTYTPASDIPQSDRIQVPGHHDIDWEKDLVPHAGGHFYPVMPLEDLIQVLTDDGWTRIEMPGHPGSLVFERLADY